MNKDQEIQRKFFSPQFNKEVQHFGQQDSYPRKGGAGGMGGITNQQQTQGLGYKTPAEVAAVALAP